MLYLVLNRVNLFDMVVLKEDDVMFVFLFARTLFSGCNR